MYWKIWSRTLASKTTQPHPTRLYLLYIREGSNVSDFWVKDSARRTKSDARNYNRYTGNARQPLDKFMKSIECCNSRIRWPYKTPMSFNENIFG